MFIDEIKNGDKYWAFTLVNKEVIIGAIIDHRKNDDGVLLTILVSQDPNIPKEIPWHSVVYLTEFK